MSTDPQKNNDNQEIDLSQISKSITGAIDVFKNTIYRCIKFVINNIVLLGVLFVLGAGLGFYMDKTQKMFNHEIIVSPNFGSTDYLYSKIDLLKSKVKQRDEKFLNSIGIRNPKLLSNLEVTPITDIYKFVNNSDKNFELLKLMAEDGDIKRILQENTTSKNYVFHKVTFSSEEAIDIESTVNPILNFLNDSKYYQDIQKVHLKNVAIKMKSNDSTIAQIDGVLNEFSSAVNKSGKSDKLVYYNENTQLNDVINTKEELIEEQGNHRIDLITTDKIIKDNSTTINIENTESINGKMKLILPFLFVFIYLFFRGVVSFYKKQKALNND